MNKKPKPPPVPDPKRPTEVIYPVAPKCPDCGCSEFRVSQTYPAPAFTQANQRVRCCRCGIRVFVWWDV